MPNPDDKLRKIMATVPAGEHVHSAQLLLDMLDERERKGHNNETFAGRIVRIIRRVVDRLRRTR